MGHYKYFRRANLTAKEIGEKLGVDYKTIQWWVRRYKLYRDDPDPVKTLMEISNKVTEFRLMGIKPRTEAIKKAIDNDKKKAEIGLPVTPKPKRIDVDSMVHAYRKIEEVLEDKEIMGLINEEARLELKDANDFLKNAIFDRVMEGK